MSGNGLTKHDLIDFERKIAERFDNGEIPYLIHLSGGNEDQLIEIFKEVSHGDYIFSTHRNHYHYLLANGDPGDLEWKIINGRSMFVFNRKLNFYSSSIVAGSVAIAVGVAWALKRKGSKQYVWCFVGDGAEDEGHFYEATRYVQANSLPCIFVIEDNDRSVNASKRERWGENDGVRWPNCVKRYHYTPTYPHGGTGSGKWLEFKKDAIIFRGQSKKQLLPVFSPLNKPMKNHYKQAIQAAMHRLSTYVVKPVVFVGYNVRHGAAYGTLSDVPESKTVEAPVAENLMAGLAMGMSLEGFRPVLFFERHDFVFNAFDIMVNQLDKVEMLSDGEYKFPMIIRAVSGSVKPFYAGPTHTSNLTELFKSVFHFPVFEPTSASEVLGIYEAAMHYDGPIMVCEKKELYDG